MRASDFEFRYRFWIFMALFWGAFGCYALDHVNAGAWLVERLAPGLVPAAELPAPGSEAAETRALQGVFAAGAALALLGALLRTWATGFLRSAVVHDHVVHSDRLVADGPYRFVRNPLYLGTQIMMLGVMPMASRLGAVVLLVGGLVFHLRLIGREEAALAVAQGEAFRAYCARVPKFVPALAPRVPGSGRWPHWLEGFAAEAFFWMFGLAMIAFAITLDGRIMMITAFAGIAVYWGATLLLRRRTAR